jgi:hypothetical protein
LDAAVETVSVDFKLRLDWSKSRVNKLKTAKDIVCLANRAGGLLVVGVQDKPTVTPVGLADDDLLPDVTQLNEFVHQYFDPPVASEVGIVTVAGVRYGVIAVPPFSRQPHICSRDGPDEQGGLVVRDGDVYVRSDAMDCRRAHGPEMRGLIDRAVAATGVAIRSALGSPSDAAVPLELRPDHPIESSALQRYATLRAADLSPIPSAAPRGIRELETLLSNSAVVARWGDSLIPRYLNRLGGGQGLMIRQPSGVTFEAEVGTEDRLTLSVAEASRTLDIRLRESLWEDASNDPGMRGQSVDIESLAAFTLGTLLFGAKLYAAANAPRFAVSLGLLAPLGRRLWINPAHFIPFMESYRASSKLDLWVTREVSTDQAAAQEERQRIAYALVAELVEYFGYVLLEGTWAALLRQTRADFGTDL